jgi:hypothetical protein
MHEVRVHDVRVRLGAHLSPGTVERVADAMVQGMVARITPLLERTHSAVRDTHSAVLQGTAEVKSEVKNSAAEVKAEVKAGATEVKALILQKLAKFCSFQSNKL